MDDAREHQMLVEGRHLRLIAADVVQRFGQQRFERAARRLSQKGVGCRNAQWCWDRIWPHPLEAPTTAHRSPYVSSRQSRDQRVSRER